MPDRPVLPIIGAESLACLDDEAYEALATRDAMLQAHIRRLEAVLLSTHKAPGDS